MRKEYKKDFQKWVKQRTNQHLPTQNLLNHTIQPEILDFAYAAYKKGIEVGKNG